MAAPVVVGMIFRAGGARAAQFFLMALVEDDLVIGVGVDGGHHGVEDAEFLVHNLGGGGQAVGGAGGVGNHVVLGGVVLVFIDAQHDGEIFILGRGGDDDLLGAAGLDVDVGAGFALGGIAVGIRENAGRFDHDIHAQVFPGQFGRDLFRRRL